MVQDTSNPVTADCGTGLDSQNHEVVMVAANCHNLRNDILEEVVRVERTIANQKKLPSIDHDLVIYQNGDGGLLLMVWVILAPFLLLMAHMFHWL